MFPKIRNQKIKFSTSPSLPQFYLFAFHEYFQILDALDLKIHNVSDEASGQRLDFVMGDPEQYIGSKFEVTLPSASNDSLTNIKIEYTTSSNASGLVWLKPGQTAGKHTFK